MIMKIDIKLIKKTGEVIINKFQISPNGNYILGNSKNVYNAKKVTAEMILGESISFELNDNLEILTSKKGKSKLISLSPSGGIMYKETELVFYLSKDKKSVYARYLKFNNNDPREYSEEKLYSYYFENFISDTGQYLEGLLNYDLI